jgi:hypothetical protein
VQQPGGGHPRLYEIVGSCGRNKSKYSVTKTACPAGL